MMIQSETSKLTLTNQKTYLFALAFICGNLLFPQLCHLIPRGGLIFLPIYFFTLIGAFRYGKTVGLLTAVLSPLINCLCFGMPPIGSLPAIMIKSIALSWIAASIGMKNEKATFKLLALTVIGYQFVGMSFEFVHGLSSGFTFMDSMLHALQDIRIGFPGLLIQVILGKIIIEKLYKYEV